jgi:phage antirepressor YoqD-like protein
MHTTTSSSTNTGASYISDDDEPNEIVEPNESNEPNESACQNNVKFIVGNLVQVVSKCQSTGKIGEVTIVEDRVHVHFKNNTVRQFLPKNLRFIQHTKMKAPPIPNMNQNNRNVVESAIIHNISDAVVIDTFTIQKIISLYQQLNRQHLDNMDHQQLFEI